MGSKHILLLTHDPELAATARGCWHLLDAEIHLDTNPEHLALLFALFLDDISAVVVDDSAPYAHAWVAAVHGLGRKIPIVGISGSHPRFLRENPAWRGVDQWLPKGLTCADLVEALQPYSQFPSRRRPAARPRLNSRSVHPPLHSGRFGHSAN